MSAYLTFSFPNVQQKWLAGITSSGAVSYIEVLDAERSLFATQQTILDLTYSR
ncbi:TPA: hypothetical protein OFW86_004637, partial [Escherichia coli]|nr:hypothetical protein [Escherichia coli]